MTKATEFPHHLLVGMAPQLAESYRQWYPFCRQAVLDMVEQVGSREFLSDALGEPLTDQQYSLLCEAWLEPCRAYNLRGGKMMRPFLVCLCVSAHGGDPATMPGLVALPELIHAVSLILDDIADDSPLRRGGPTAHRMVGLKVAGVMASAWLNSCFELLADGGLGLSRDAADLLAERIAWEHWVTGIGTTIDTTWPWLGRVDHLPEQYIQSIAHRTGSYSFRLPLTVGAIAAGATAEQRGQWTAFGEELGVAFQIIDDVLNVQRHDDSWGKALAEDLTQGKVNLQVLVAVQRAAEHDRDQLLRILASHTDDPSRLIEAVAIMDRAGAFDAASDIAAHHIAQAKQIAGGMDFLPESHRRVLDGFIDYALKRTH